MLTPLVIPMGSDSNIIAARRGGRALAAQLNFSQKNMDKLAIIITELATNLIKHATKEAQLILQPVESLNASYLDIISLDKGPGIKNISQSLKDGYSTTQTSGTGLGAISRLSDKFNIYSFSLGSVVWARIENKTCSSSTSWDISSLCIPKTGQSVCGDSFAIHTGKTTTTIFVADGLGHGLEAHEAASCARDIFQKNSDMPPPELINHISRGLKHTRGTAIAIATLDKKENKLKVSGIGNITGRVFFDHKMRHIVSHDGVVGIGQYNVPEYYYPWDAHARLIMHSDGLVSRWTLSDYPGLLSRPSAILMSVLYRDFCRGYDDTTIVVVQQAHEK